MKRSKRREAYASDDLLLPELAMLGTDAPRSAAVSGLDPHVHEDAYEICYIASGSVTWWVANDQVYEIGPGFAFVTRPGEPHGGMDAVLHPCELYWVQLRSPGRGVLPGMDRAASRALVQSLGGLSRRCFAVSSAVEACFNRLLAEHRQPDAWSVLAGRSALHDLLAHTLRGHDAGLHRRRRDVDRQGQPIREALHWLEAHYTEEFSIEALAARVGMSPTHFHERFRREVGHTPAEWRLRLRVGLAKQLLAEAKPTITEIAMRCGFSSSQYFATAFKRLVGVPPGTYRQHHANSADINMNAIPRR